jgi:hypothetical protein
VAAPGALPAGDRITALDGVVGALIDRALGSVLAGPLPGHGDSEASLSRTSPWSDAVTFLNNWLRAGPTVCRQQPPPFAHSIHQLPQTGPRLAGVIETVG